MAQLRLENITLKVESFLLRQISFEVQEGSYFILLGPSGAGKSLILEMISGFIQPVEGSIYLDDIEISNMPVQQRQVGLLFQDFALFPHLSVFNNIAYPVRKIKRSNNLLNHEIQKLAKEMEIEPLLHRMPDTLSGGEKQRVALARTLIRKPKVLLLDEPLAALDVQLRGGIRSLLRRLNNQGQTIVHVTHDYEEAAILGQRIAVLENNTIAQCGSHDEVFHNPRSAFIANFVGIRNFFPGNIRPLFGGMHEINIDGVIIRTLCEPCSGPGFAVIRSEDIILSTTIVESSAVNWLKGVVQHVEPARVGLEVTINAGITLVALVSDESAEKLDIRHEKPIYAGFKASAVRFISG